MASLSVRVRAKIIKILRDNFGFFYPLGNRTVLAVEYALQHNVTKGHYYEFGLYQGYTFCQAVKLSPEIHHFGFDSFEGMPENAEGGGFHGGRFAVTYKKVINHLLANNTFSHKEHLVKGFFSDTLTTELQQELMTYKAGVVLIDADLYSSAVEVLDFIAPLLQTGTLVVFDDWDAFDDTAGERRALREFLAKSPHLLFTEVTDCTHRKIFRVSVTV